MILIDEYDQQSPEWFQERLSSIGGSSIGTVASKGTGRQNLLYKFAGEILSQKKDDNGYKGWQLDRGNEYEPVARRYYELINQVEVRQIALAKYDEYRHYSPDGLVGEDGFIEIKIVIPSVFCEFADKGVLPTQDRRQVQWGFKILKQRKWCDYIKYCPEIKEAGTMSPMIVKRIEPDPKEIKQLEDAAVAFIQDLKELVARIKGE